MADYSAPVTSEALMRYLGIEDDADEMTAANVEMAAQSANAYLAGALGASADLSDPRALAVGLAAAADVYDNRCMDDGKASSAVRRMVADLCAQMRLEAVSS